LPSPSGPNRSELIKKDKHFPAVPHTQSNATMLAMVP
jgi:hypothetical protein